MILFIIAILVLAAGLFFGAQLTGHKGYVLLVIENTNYELSVTTALIIIGCVFLVIILLAWLLFTLLQWNSSTRQWLSKWGKQKNESTLGKGFLALASGEYKQACHLLNKAASRSPFPEVAYLFAFKGAWELGDLKLQNRFIQKAQTHAQDPLAVLFSLAQAQAAQEQYQLASETLAELQDLKLTNPAVLQLQMRVQLALKQWRSAQGSLSKLIKAKLVSESQAEQLLLQVYQGRFTELAKAHDHRSLAELWNSLPRKDKKLESVRMAICTAFIDAGDPKAAYQLLGDLIANDPNSPYLPLLCQLQLDDYYPVLEQVRALYEKYENNHELQSVFAQLLVKSEKWQEAVPLLKFVLSVRETYEDLMALGLALEHLGQYQAAIQAYKQAISYGSKVL